MELPETTKDITVDWLNQALHENGFLGNANIISFEQEKIGVGRGFLSDMAKLTLAYDRDAPHLPGTMIPKLPPSYPSARELVMRVNLFEREIRFYNEMAPQSPLRTPGLIYSAIDSENQRYVLLMEDCSRYTEADPHLEGLTYQQTKIIALKIADFHARWWDDENLFSFPWLLNIKEPDRAAFFIDNRRANWDACTRIEDFRQALPDGGWEAGLKINEHFAWFMESMPDDKLTILHWDLRADNLFFDWDTPQDPLVVFDWATPSIERGARDLSFTIGFSMATELRRQVEKEIVKLYYQRLLDRGVSGYSFDECWTDYLRGLLFLTNLPLITFSRADLSNPRGTKLANVATQRCFSAVVVNDATSLFP